MFYGNQYIGSFDMNDKKVPLGKRIVRSFKRTLLTAAKTLIIVWMVIGGMWVGEQKAESIVTHANVEVIKEVEVVKFVKAPIMERIAKCESGNKHFDTNGQVLMRSNTNKSVDLGKFQINTVWFAKATELGLDLNKEEDNEKMAYYIYHNFGTNPWYSSEHCWSK